MKTKYFVFLTLLSLTFFSFKSINSNAAKSISILQDTTTVEGVYDGHEDYGYNFIVKDSDERERTLTFQKIDKTLLNEFDLNAQTLVGKKFKVIYTTKIEVTKDSDNFDQENEIYTIIKLEKV